MDPITHLIPLRARFIFHLFYRGRFNYELAVGDTRASICQCLAKRFLPFQNFDQIGIGVEYMMVNNSCNEGWQSSRLNWYGINFAHHFWLFGSDLDDR